MTREAMETLAPVITIDGPGGSGKGTVAMRLANRLGWHFLDSGALYRLVALAARRHDVPLDDGQALARMIEALDVRFRFRGDRAVVELDGDVVTDELRLESTGSDASVVAVLPEVRQALVRLQHGFREMPGLVADGRDMGTVIFPDACLKIFLTASVEERARRRYNQLKEKGESVNLPRLFRDIEARDRRDASRPVSPLVPAEDAVVIDSTALSVNDVLREIYKAIEDRRIIG